MHCGRPKYTKTIEIHLHIYNTYSYQLVQLRMSTSKRKSRIRARKAAGNRFENLLAIPSSLSRSYSTFPLYSWTTLNEIAVHIKIRIAALLVRFRLARCGSNDHEHNYNV